MNKLLIAGKSDIALKNLEDELKRIDSPIMIKQVDDLELLKEGGGYRFAIIDLSVYTYGVLDRLENYKSRNPLVDVVAMTYSDEVGFDQLLLQKGADVVSGMNDLIMLVSKKLIKLSNTG